VKAIIACLLLTLATPAFGRPCQVRDLAGTWRLVVVQTFSDGSTEHKVCNATITTTAEPQSGVFNRICHREGVFDPWYAEDKSYDLRVGGRSPRTCSAVMKEPDDPSLELRWDFSRDRDVAIAQGEILFDDSNSTVFGYWPFIATVTALRR
jgi:hypothetical protein